MLTGPRRRLAILLAIALQLGACTGGDGSPSPSAAESPTAIPSAATPSAATPVPDPLEVYRAIAAEVVAIRGLDAPSRIDPRIIDAAQLRANIEAEFEASNPAAEILLGERLLKGLGLLPADASLRDMYIDLQGSQVIGYYDPAVDELFLVSRSGGLGPIERVTYAHEFTHELQDRQFDLESLGLDEALDQGDRALAVLALVEGDAVSVQTTWMTANLSVAELAELAAGAADPEMLAVLARTPPILLETSLFPYTAGSAFVTALLAAGGYAAVDVAFANLPVSTEQVIHPEKYLAGEEPVDVSFPADLAARLGAGWTLDAQDTLGELQLRVWLRQGGVAGDVARLAAEGWGGDRVALLGGPGVNDDVVVIVIEWDTIADAAAFRVAATDAATGLSLNPVVATSGRRVVIALMPDAGAIDVRPILEALAAG
ncbi:MAG: hypothetical protein HW391_1318 [Chloroflexi bacterium]|nr:hypothetical protein [Chloroflexota bacterium]